MAVALTAVVVVYLLASFLTGFVRGLRREALALLAMLLALGGGWLLREPAAELLAAAGLVNPLLTGLLALPAAYLAIYLILMLMLMFAEKMLELPKPDLGRRAAGAVLGLARAAGLAALVLMLLSALPGWREASPLVAALADTPLALQIKERSGIAPYESLLRVAQQQPERLRAMAERPEVKALVEYPPLQQVLADSEVQRLARARDFTALINDPRLTAVLNDPGFRDRLAKIDVRALLADTAAASTTTRP